MINFPSLYFNTFLDEVPWLFMVKGVIHAN